MVVFTCNHCGESLQKPRVEKHSFTCRQERFLTCVDCFKDFRGDEYNIHTKCITEEQRYSGKDFVQKSKKGEVKQESWMEMIKSIILHEKNLSPSCKNLLSTVSNYNNVPRKKVKFINFIKSSTGGRTNNNDIESIWNIIENYKTQSTLNTGNNSDTTIIKEINENGSEENKPQNGSVESENGNCVKSKKKRKRHDAIHDTTNDHTDESPKKKKIINGTNEETEIVTGNEQSESTESNIQSFSFNDHIFHILTKRKNIQTKKLYKKISKAYTKFTGETIVQEKLEKKINKKLKKIENVQIENDLITLMNK